jgi:O-palmitoleoyl-L-serine hydrolase
MGPAPAGRRAAAAALATAVAAALLTAATASAAGADDGFVLHLFPADGPAKCLDGTPGGYYLRPGSQSQWMIEMEGGGWCYDPASCKDRAAGAIGSSKNWPPRGCPSMDGGSKGMLSNNCTVSRFCNWTAVHANYCDGGSFAGHVDAPLNVSGTQLWFRGRDILDATIDALLAAGLASADELIFKGCSAGGLAVLLHADYVAGRVRAANPKIRVVAMPDAGFFLDHPAAGGAPSVYTPEIRSAVALHQPLVAGSVNDGCLAAYPDPAQQWRCFMAQFVLEHITTPMFMTQDGVDTWQMANILGLGCSPWVAGSCNATQLAWMAAYRLDMLAALAPLLQSPTNGAFITSCVQHCHQNNDPCWMDGKVANQTLADSFWAWYTGDATLQRIVVDGPYGGNPTCFCTPYQTARAFHGGDAVVGAGCSGGCGAPPAPLNR